MNYFLTFFLAIALLGTGCLPDESRQSQVTPVDLVSFKEINEIAAESAPKPAVVAEKSPPPTTLPRELNLNVPFFSQAPQGDWGEPYQEACEEASLLLAYYYVTGQTPSIAEFEARLLEMVEWEVEYFGQYEHTTAAQTAEMASLFLNYDAWEVVTEPTALELKNYLAKGYPVVAPFAGRYLGNPHFTGLGPVYHMLVIRGYEDGKFITNDVGTRHGENFLYSEEVLLEALHDWHDDASVNDEGILKGDKVVLVLKPA